MRTKEEITKNLEGEEKKLKETIRRINELEETPIILEYISLLNGYEITKREISKIQTELKTRQMYDCNHLLVQVPKTSDDTSILKSEVCVYCLKCGVSNSVNIPSIVPAKKMCEIVASTIHNGRYVYDGIVTDIDYAQRIYKELLDSNMNEENIKTALEIKLSSQKKTKNK